MTGKPAAGDLRQHKKSLPVVAALASGGDAGRRLAEVLSDAARSEASLREAVVLIEATGGKAFARAEAERRIEGARNALLAASLEPGPVQELLDVAAFVTGRDF